MSENEYLLPLKEWELKLLSGAVAALASLVRSESETMVRCNTMADKLRALEPIGTGGTTEGDG